MLIDRIDLGDQGAPYSLTYYVDGTNVYGFAYFGNVESGIKPGLSSGISNGGGTFLVVGMQDVIDTSVSATTSGSLIYFIGTGASISGWKYIFNFSSYENDTTTDQQISFPIQFRSISAIAVNTTGLTITMQHQATQS